MTTYFHYTNIQTFEAIVKSGFWRFSSLEDANDKRERYSNLNDDIFAECHYICASRNNTNAALWHHYANKHNGVCIEIEISSKDWKPTEIKYDGKRQDLNDASITIDEAREYLTHNHRLAAQEKRCHCEPVRTLAWQSPWFPAAR